MALILAAGSQAEGPERLPKDTWENGFLNLPTSAPGPKSIENAHRLGISFQSYMLVQDKLGFLENLTTPASPSSMLRVMLLAIQLSISVIIGISFMLVQTSESNTYMASLALGRDGWGQLWLKPS